MTGIPHPRNKPLDTSRIRSIRMGTTVATNALLERKGDRCALVITKGFKDLLYIGNQARPKIFDLKIETPDQIYEIAVEVNERVVLVPPQEQVFFVFLSIFFFFYKIKNKNITIKINHN